MGSILKIDQWISANKPIALHLIKHFLEKEIFGSYFPLTKPNYLTMKLFMNFGKYLEQFITPHFEGSTVHFNLNVGVNHLVLHKLFIADSNAISDYS